MRTATQTCRLPVVQMAVLLLIAFTMIVIVAEMPCVIVRY